MIPSSGYLFSLFSRQICNFQQLFNCRCHEKDNKVHVSAKVRQRAFDSGADEVLVRETVEKVRENYKELGECCAALQRMMETLSFELGRPTAPCGELRRALQDCYTSHVYQPLKCHDLVTTFIQCARNHVLTAQS